MPGVPWIRRKIGRSNQLVPLGNESLSDPGSVFVFEQGTRIISLSRKPPARDPGRRRRQVTALLYLAGSLCCVVGGVLGVIYLLYVNSHRQAKHEDMETFRTTSCTVTRISTWLLGRRQNATDTSPIRCFSFNADYYDGNGQQKTGIIIEAFSDRLELTTEVRGQQFVRL